MGTLLRPSSEKLSSFTRTFMVLSLCLWQAACAPAPDVDVPSDDPSNIPAGPFIPPEETSDNETSEYDHLDPGHVVPTDLLKKTVQYYDANLDKIKNPKQVVIIDFNQHSSKKRMYVIDMLSGMVEQYFTAHGFGSDSDGDGYAKKFSNVEGSKMSSLGFYLTGGLYTGSHGKSMYLHGLEASNSNAYKRAIVVHGADYVQPSWVGRSWGCPAIEMKYISTLLPRIQAGTLMYAHYSP